jgi:hypothetical protein
MDKNRTISNMQAAAIKYCHTRYRHFENWPIYVEDEKNPRCLVGIEQHFDVVLHFSDGRRIRYIGTIDGLVWKLAKKWWVLDENKTANRLSDAWEKSFDMSHQITGYCAASTSVFGFPVMRSRVVGCKIKPTGAPDDVMSPEPLERTLESIQAWGRWVRNTVVTFEKFKDNFEHADRYTHACQRYFRPCSLLAFCADSPEGRQIAYHEQMVEAELTPSEKAIADG